MRILIPITIILLVISCILNNLTIRELRAENQRLRDYLHEVNIARLKSSLAQPYE